MNTKWIALAALVVSVISLAYSIWTNFVNRRAVQFQKLAELRTKVASLRWKMYYRLLDLREIIKQYSAIDAASAHDWSDTIATLERQLGLTQEDEENLTELYKFLERFPFVLPTGSIEAIHHGIDSMTASVDISRKNLIPKLRKIIEENKPLFDQIQDLKRQIAKAEHDAGVSETASGKGTPTT